MFWCGGGGNKADELVSQRTILGRWTTYISVLCTAWSISDKLFNLTVNDYLLHGINWNQRCACSFIIWGKYVDFVNSLTEWRAKRNWSWYDDAVTHLLLGRPIWWLWCRTSRFFARLFVPTGGLGSRPFHTWLLLHSSKSSNLSSSSNVNSSGFSEICQRTWIGLP